MSNFLTAFKITNANEGGYSISPDDHGGETYMGISRVNWPQWKGWPIIDANKPLKDNQILNDTQLQSLVESFYKANFWDALRLDNVDDQQIAEAVYDFGVNSGTGRSAKTLQLALNQVGANVTVDGQIGDQTLEAVNNHPYDSTYDKFCEIREDFYRNLATKPGQAQFLKSWLSRIKPYQA